MNEYLVIIVLISALPVFYLFYLARKRYRLLKNIEATRYHIARDLHDDIGATLSSISFYTHAMKQQVNAGNTHAIPEILDRVGVLSREMIDSMNDIVWMVNPQNDTTDKFFDKIETFGTNICAARNIVFMFYADQNVLDIRFDMYKRKEYFLICKEAINNAIKYADCNSLELLITRRSDSILTVIKDNGKGFNENEVKGGNGLLNMKVRVANLGGKLDLSSSIGTGTTLSFRFDVPPKW